MGVLTSAPAQAAAPVVDRLSGSDRYATSAMVSAKSFAPGATWKFTNFSITDH